ETCAYFKTLFESTGPFEDRDAKELNFTCADDAPKDLKESLDTETELAYGARQFGMFLGFLYCQDEMVNTAEYDLWVLIQLGTRFVVPLLVKKCEQLLLKRMSLRPNNWPAILGMAKRYALKQIHDAVVLFIVERRDLWYHSDQLDIDDFKYFLQ